MVLGTLRSQVSLIDPCLPMSFLPRAVWNWLDPTPSSFHSPSLLQLLLPWDSTGLSDRPHLHGGCQASFPAFHYLDCTVPYFASLVVVLPCQLPDVSTQCLQLFLLQALHTQLPFLSLLLSCRATLPTYFACLGSMLSCFLSMTIWSCCMFEKFLFLVLHRGR